MQFVFEREKYISIAKNETLSKAVATLHQDMWEVEYQCFENVEGYDPQVWKLLTEMRLFSREMWDLKLKPQNEW
jgi:hypothetical protein